MKLLQIILMDTFIDVGTNLACKIPIIQNFNAFPNNPWDTASPPPLCQCCDISICGSICVSDSVSVSVSVSGRVSSSVSGSVVNCLS